MFYKNKGLLDLSFLIDADHSMQFVSLEGFIGIAKTESQGKHPKSVRLHNAYIAEVLKEVKQKVTQENALEISLPGQMISEGCPNF